MGWKRCCAMAGVGALLWVCSEAPGAAAWVGQPYHLVVPAHISASAQSISGSVNLTLDHDAPCTLAVSVASSGDEVLKRGASTLTTFYKLSGPQVPNSDGDWVSADEFLTHIYTVSGSGAADTITLSVRATAPAQAAPDAGDYSASLILTVSW